MVENLANSLSGLITQEMLNPFKGGCVILDYVLAETRYLAHVKEVSVTGEKGLEMTFGRVLKDFADSGWQPEEKIGYLNNTPLTEYRITSQKPTELQLYGGSAELVISFYTPGHPYSQPLLGNPN
jgi:hypothetical protein